MLNVPVVTLGPLGVMFELSRLTAAFSSPDCAVASRLTLARKSCARWSVSKPWIREYAPDCELMALTPSMTMPLNCGVPGVPLQVP